MSSETLKLLSIPVGRDPHIFFEQAVEVVLVRDPDDCPNLVGGQGSRAEELLGLLDAKSGDILVDCTAEVFFKAAAQMVLAVGADLSVVPEQLVELLKKTPPECSGGVFLMEKGS